tara:strand:- start:712 stop:1218 length:507 start_codon:yes stop_codon:yes gene_type:complete
MLKRLPKWDAAAHLRFVEIKRDNIESVVGEIIHIMRSIEAPNNAQANIEDWIQNLEAQIDHLFGRVYDEPNVGWWGNWWLYFATHDINPKELTTLERANEILGPNFEFNPNEVNPQLKYNAEMVYQVRGGGFQEFPEFDVHKGITETLIGLLFMLSGLARNYNPGYDF